VTKIHHLGTEMFLYKFVYSVVSCEYMKDNVKALNDLAISNGGQCLSTEYKGCKSKYRWKCSKGHEWETCLYNVKSGHWCPECSKERINKKWEKYRDEQKIVYYNIAKSRNGECMSDYRNLFTKMKFRCSEGHEWETLPLNIKTGHWCPICSRKNRTQHTISDEVFERIMSDIFGKD
jgi:hypothetical protein